MKKALIFGITGQGGIFLSNHLIKKKYKVYGYCRNLKKKKNLNKKIKLFQSKKLSYKFVFNLFYIELIDII